MQNASAGICPRKQTTCSRKHHRARSYTSVCLGFAATRNNAPCDTEHCVLMWTEANKYLVRGSLGRHAGLQDALVLADVLMSGGEELWLAVFVRTAACNATPGLAYAFTRYRSPWAAPRHSPEPVVARGNWERHGRGAKGERDNLALAQTRGTRCRPEEANENLSNADRDERNAQSRADNLRPPRPGASNKAAGGSYSWQST